MSGPHGSGSYSYPENKDGDETEQSATHMPFIPIVPPAAVHHNHIRSVISRLMGSMQVNTMSANRSYRPLMMIPKQTDPLDHNHSGKCREGHENQTHTESVEVTVKGTKVMKPMSDGTKITLSDKEVETNGYIENEKMHETHMSGRFACSPDKCGCADEEMCGCKTSTSFIPTQPTVNESFGESKNAEDAEHISTPHDSFIPEHGLPQTADSQLESMISPPLESLSSSNSQENDDANPFHVHLSQQCLHRGYKRKLHDPEATRVMKDESTLGVSENKRMSGVGFANYLPFRANETGITRVFGTKRHCATFTTRKTSANMGFGENYFISNWQNFESRENPVPIYNCRNRFGDSYMTSETQTNIDGGYQPPLTGCDHLHPQTTVGNIPGKQAIVAPCQLEATTAMAVTKHRHTTTSQGYPDAGAAIIGPEGSVKAPKQQINQSLYQTQNSGIMNPEREDDNCALREQTSVKGDIDSLTKNNKMSGVRLPDYLLFQDNETDRTHVCGTPIYYWRNRFGDCYMTLAAKTNVAGGYQKLMTDYYQFHSQTPVGNFPGIRAIVAPHQLQATTEMEVPKHRHTTTSQGYPDAGAAIIGPEGSVNVPKQQINQSFYQKQNSGIGNPEFEDDNCVLGDQTSVKGDIDSLTKNNKDSSTTRAEKASNGAKSDLRLTTLAGQIFIFPYLRYYHLDNKFNLDCNDQTKTAEDSDVDIELSKIAEACAEVMSAIDEFESRNLSLPFFIILLMCSSICALLLTSLYNIGSFLRS